MSNPYQTSNQPPPPPPIIYNQGWQPVNDQGFSPSGTICMTCHRQTESFPKKVPGNVTYLWCVALFFLTGVLCCVPFCVNGCQDTLLVCVICQRGKARIKANCCWLIKQTSLLYNKIIAMPLVYFKNRDQSEQTVLFWLWDMSPYFEDMSQIWGRISHFPFRFSKKLSNLHYLFILAALSMNKLLIMNGTSIISSVSTEWRNGDVSIISCLLLRGSFEGEVKDGLWGELSVFSRPAEGMIVGQFVK